MVTAHGSSEQMTPFLLVGKNCALPARLRHSVAIATRSALVAFQKPKSSERIGLCRVDAHALVKRWLFLPSEHMDSRDRGKIG
jgi:hypothetical protein